MPSQLPTGGTNVAVGGILLLIGYLPPRTAEPPRRGVVNETVIENGSQSRSMPAAATARAAHAIS